MILVIIYGILFKQKNNKIKCYSVILYQFLRPVPYEDLIIKICHSQYGIGENVSICQHKSNISQVLKSD